MNTYSCILGASLMALSSIAAAEVSEQNAWQRAYPVTNSKPKLFVRNVFGNVSVRAGNAKEIVVAVSERRSAPTRAALDEAKERLQLHTEATSEGVSFVVEDPNQGSVRTELCRQCRIEYEFDITVPAETQVDVGTVTDGRVDVMGVRGAVSARNVNGPVAVAGLAQCSQIESVNGALDVSFTRAPDKDCALKTINGDITLGLPANAGLDAMLSVTHGELRSDFDIEPLAATPTVDREERDSGSLYRIDQKAGVRLGAGGPTFTFASLNGDVRFVKNP